MKRAWYLILEEHAGWRFDGGQDAIMFVISLVCGSW